MPDTTDALLAELDQIRDDIALASELPMTRDPRRVIGRHAPRLMAALDEVLALAGELDVEDGYTPEPDALRRPVSRGDRIRAAISRHLPGEQHT